MRKAILLLIIALITGVTATWGQSWKHLDLLERCPTLARLNSVGQLGQITGPVFTDREAARRFGLDCRRIVDELGRFPALPPDYAELRGRAALAAAFLDGDVYLLSSSNIDSVVKLREQVKIAPPAGFVYVKKYKSESSMPPVIRQAFESMARDEGIREQPKVQGITIQGRYIAILQSDFHGESEDTLSHEMVHAYVTLACESPLPKWFQEGAAVYFSLGGKDRKHYNNTENPRLVKSVNLPEDYKSNLYSFQYIESKIGRDRLFKFIRDTVETGDPDVRSAMGMKPPAPPKPQQPLRIPPYAIAAAIGVAVLAVIVAARAALRREETW